MSIVPNTCSGCKYAYTVRSYTPEYGWMREFVGNRKDAVAEYRRLKSIYDTVEIEKKTIATHNRVAKKRRGKRGGRGGREMSKPKKLIDRLDMWEWTVLVAAWRYYEYRMTITSSMFPAEIIERFWRSGKYADSVKRQIAHQFWYVDHGIRGEDDWTGSCLRDCDREAWCKFYTFCRAWCEGFARLTLDDGRGHREEVDAFYCEWTKRWYGVEDYIANPLVERWCADKFIVAKKEEAL